ncbi:MAG: hypothetical protein IJ730_02360 [Alphaproteobacteria bacterium]|nr:hypothetical protein [Alphaproteobacteria bacterium]
MSEEKLAVIIDGSSFIFRAFFACPPMKSNDGRSVGAVHGFCSMLISQLCKHNSDTFCVAMDSGRQTFRLEMYPQYKANRVSMPDDLRQQMPLMQEACAAFGLPTLAQPGIEADDLIASYSNILSNKGYKVRIVGIDKDLLQLLSDKVEIYNPIKEKVVTKEDVIKKYGVTPDQMIDFQALVGDTADNVPGVAGIGPVTAAKLINTYGSISNIYANVNTITPQKLKEKLLTHKEDAELSKKLVTLKKDVKIFDIFPSIKLDYKHEKAHNFLTSLGFNSLIHRMYKTSFYAKSSASFLQHYNEML